MHLPHRFLAHRHHHHHPLLHPLIQAHLVGGLCFALMASLLALVVIGALLFAQHW